MSEAIKKLYRFGNSWTGTIIIVLVVIFFFAQAFKIPSGSMLPTLLIGDHLFVKKFAYGVPTPHIPFVEIPIMPDFNHNGHIVTASGPKRGDIVVFRPPFNEKIHYVKRNVAVGGDEVMVHNGTLYLAPKNGDEDIKANFNGYEIVLLGDIHKHQYMNKERTVCYAGSLIQQNHGESRGGHGYVKWNTETKESRLKEIENEYGYMTIKIEEGEVI